MHHQPVAVRIDRRPQRFVAGHHLRQRRGERLEVKFTVDRQHRRIVVGAGAVFRHLGEQPELLLRLAHARGKGPGRRNRPLLSNAVQGRQPFERERGRHTEVHEARDFVDTRFPETLDDRADRVG